MSDVSIFINFIHKHCFRYHVWPVHFCYVACAIDCRCVKTFIEERALTIAAHVNPHSSDSLGQGTFQ